MAAHLTKCVFRVILLYISSASIIPDNKACNISNKHPNRVPFGPDAE